MVHTGNGGIHGVDSDVQSSLSRIAPPLRENILAATGDLTQRPEPLDHFGYQRNRQGLAHLSPTARKPPNLAGIGGAFEVELLPLRLEQFALADSKREQQLDREAIRAAEAGRLAAP